MEVTDDIYAMREAVLCIAPLIRDGMTVEMIAKDLGVNRRTITTLKRGTSKGDWLTLLKCAHYFGVPIKELLKPVPEYANTTPGDN